MKKIKIIGIFMIMVMAVGTIGCSKTTKKMESMETPGIIEETTETKIEEESIGDEEVQKTSEQTEEESTEQIEMVDWETWATQPDYDEPCLVVWNEKLGKQLIIEKGGKYIAEEGDKLAVPAKEGIVHQVLVYSTAEKSTPQQLIQTEYGGYYEIILEYETNHILFMYKEEGDTEEAYSYTVKTTNN